MRKMQVAIALIQQGDSFLLQLRDGPKKIGGAGLIGCFGGKISSSEKPLQTICREIAEETTIKARPKDFTYLGAVKVKSDHNLEPVQVTLQVFKMNLPHTYLVQASEGKLVSLALDDVKANLDKLTTGTRAAFMEFA